MNNIKLPENIEEIKKFADEIGIDVKYLLGEKYEGYLNLETVEYLPNNIQFNFGSNLHLRSVRSLPDNIVFNVGGDLSLYVKSLPANIKFNVGGFLDLRSVKYLPENIVFNVNRKVFFPTKHKAKIIWN